MSSGVVGQRRLRLGVDLFAVVVGLLACWMVFLVLGDRCGLIVDA